MKTEFYYLINFFTSIWLKTILRVDFKQIIIQFINRYRDLPYNFIFGKRLEKAKRKSLLYEFFSLTYYIIYYHYYNISADIYAYSNISKNLFSVLMRSYD